MFSLSTSSHLPTSNLNHQHGDPDRQTPMDSPGVEWSLVPTRFIHLQNRNPFHPYMKPGRREDFNLFVEVFEETIKKEARQERKKYPKKFAPPEHSYVVLDEAVFMRISTAVRPWRICHRSYRYCCQGNCQEGRIGLEFCHSTSIPAKSKIMSSFAGYS